jgi:hypothetical protein
MPFSALCCDADAETPAGTTVRLKRAPPAAPILPFEAHTLISPLSFIDQHVQASGQHTDTPRADMNLACRLPAHYSMCLLSDYRCIQTSGENGDFSTFNAKSQVNWQADRFDVLSAMLTLETGYSTTADFTGHFVQPTIYRPTFK